MRSAKNIEKLIVNSNIDTSDKMDQAILADLVKKLGESHKTLSAPPGPSAWRTIMKSKLTKLAAAAVAIIAVLVCMNGFNGSVDVATIAFADIAAAMKNVAWMHQTSIGIESGVGGAGEQWIGFEAKVHAGRGSDGRASFRNTEEHKQYSYDPQSKTITINDADDFPLSLASPVAMLESMCKMAEGQGATVAARRGEYMDRQVQIQEISWSSVGPGNMNQMARMYIDPESKFLLGAEVKATDPEGNTVMEGEITFDYPATGPLSIYDLGAPRDAHIIDQSTGSK